MLKLSGIQLDDFNKNDLSEQTKKIYRYVTEALRRIEERHQKAKKIEDVFSKELLNLRLKLREYTNKLIHADPTGAGTRAIDIYWRKGIHDPVTLSKQLRGDVLSPREKGYLGSHLLSGIGHYHHLLLGLAEVHNWKPNMRLDFLDSFAYGHSHVPEKRKEKAATQADILTWLENITHKCLVYLGDLGRYRLEMLGEAEMGVGGAIAARYYHMALQVKPGPGLPYNQLATLSAGDNHGLDQVYYYLRCVTSQEGFEGGDANLRRVLEKNVGRYNEMEKGDAKEMAVVALVQLVHLVLTEGGQEEVTLACQHSLSGLHQVLQEAEGGMGGGWLEKIVAVMIMMIQKLGGNNKAAVRRSLCQAYMLALFSHLAGMFTTVVNKAVYGVEYVEESVEENDEVVEEKKEEKKDEELKKKRKGLAALLRRRRAPNSGSSDPDSDQSDEEIFYSDEEDSESALSDSLGLSDSEIESDDDVVVEEAVKLPNTEEIIRAAVKTGLLPSLRLCCCWFSACPEVLKQAGPSSGQLWTNLARMFNCLELRSRPGSLESSKSVVSRMADSRGDWPLEEDWLVRGLQIVSSQQDTVDWAKSGPQGELDEGVGRLQELAKWREWLSKQQGVGLRWNQEKGKATVGVKKSIPNPVPEPEKKDVMKHMAELWLREEVQQLEAGRVRSTPYIVLDCTALTANLHMVKRVVNSHLFLVIVPDVVVHELDAVKKMNRVAREAIRWLERELGRGNRSMRAQRSEEMMKMEMEYPHRRERARWNMFQVLECAQFLAKQDNYVTLLTGLKQGEEELSFQESISLSFGVCVEQVDGFLARWKEKDQEGGSNGRGGTNGDHRPGGTG